MKRANIDPTPMQYIDMPYALRRSIEDRLFGRLYAIKSALFYNLKGWDRR